MIEHEKPFLSYKDPVWFRFLFDLRNGYANTSE